MLQYDRQTYHPFSKSHISKGESSVVRCADDLVEFALSSCLKLAVRAMKASIKCIDASDAIPNSGRYGNVTVSSNSGEWYDG